MRWASVLVIAGLAGACHRSSSDSPPLPEMAPAAAAPAVPGKHAMLPAVPPPHAGLVITVTRNSTTPGFAQNRGERHAYDMTEHWVRRFEVLAVDGRVVTRARVTFPEENFEHRRDQQALPWSPRWRGHTYLAEWAKGALAVRREDGQALTEDEERSLRSSLYSELGRADVVGDTLGGHSLDSDVRVPLPASELAASMFEGVTLSVAEARLVDVRGDTAVIEIHMRGELTDADGHQSFEARDTYEWSTSTGRVSHLADSSSFHGTTGSATFVNRIDGTVAFEYADTAAPAEHP